MLTKNTNFLFDPSDGLSPREQCIKLFSNLYHTWDKSHRDIYTDLFGLDWRDNQPPVKLVSDMEDKQFDNFWSKNKEKIKQHLSLLDDYINDTTFFNQQEKKDDLLSKLNSNPIAYFSLEFGLVDWLNIYSGGLGVLAGDILKQSSDDGIPMIGVGVFYHKGYFIQKLADDGGQIDEYPPREVSDYPFRLLSDDDGECAEVKIYIDNHPVYVRAWSMSIGRNKLILLDTNYYKNENWEDKMITAHLYGGDEDTRIRQEILLGIGGYKMLHEIGIDPSICHMNEGHSAFVSISMADNIMHKENVDFHTALERSKQKLIFTNHTLKAAGNDIFSKELFSQYFDIYADKLGVDLNDLFAIGSEKGVTHGKFSMTIAGFNAAKISNGVSKIHAKAAKNIWPNHDLVPITNGAHMPTWVGDEFKKLYEKHLNESWQDPKSDFDLDQINEISDGALWNAHMSHKRRMVKAINSIANTKLKDDVLTLSWFRRFATYKRPDILISNIEKLKELINHDERPVQLIVGGKAHPKDTEGRKVLQHIVNTLKKDGINGKAAFLPEYNWKLARLVVQGSDVWVNTPTRFEEASGTSGMKASANGVLQYTTLDGWTDEVNWDQKGFVLPDHEATLFYGIIEDEIAPLFYDTEKQSCPKIWIEMMRKTIKTALEDYSAKRQLNDYLNKLYLPLLRDNN